MNQTALIKRAFEIARRYRVLWLFGILVALTGGGIGSGGNGPQWVLNGNDLDRWPQYPWLTEPNLNFDPGAWVGLVVFCCCLLLVAVLISIILQYVARTALIRSVDQIEATGAAPTWREGFRLGWSNRAFRLWLLELIVGIIVALAVILALALGASPLLLLTVNSGAARAIGIGLTVFLEVLMLLVIVVLAIALSLLGKFWAREVVLADRGIGDALANGYALVRARLKDTGVMWLLMLGINIGFAMIMIPVSLLVVVVAGGLGAGLGYAVHAATGGSVVWAVVAGLPIFFLLMGIPLAILGGIFESFDSGVWTLTYREVAGSAEPAAVPAEAEA